MVIIPLKNRFLLLARPMVEQIIPLSWSLWMDIEHGIAIEEEQTRVVEDLLFFTRRA